MTPKLTDKLYKQLFKVALYICHQKEDNAAECVNKVILNLDKYTAGNSEEEFWGWARKIIKNKQIDIWKKETKEEPVRYIDEMEYKEIIQQEDSDFYLNQLKKLLPPEDLKFMFNYIKSDAKKTNIEKIKFLRLKEKVKKGEQKKETKYILKYDSGNIEEYDNMVQIARKLNITPEAVRLAIKDGRSIKKEGNPTPSKKSY